MQTMTGNGVWRFQMNSSWAKLPAGIHFGGTHGAITADSAGNVYVSTQSDTGILVFDEGGNFKRNVAQRYPEVHSLICREEGGEEFLYATVLKGTEHEHWLFVKMTLQGVPVLTITAPRDAGFAAPDEWRLTSAIVAPDGDIWISNGYGDSRLLRFDSRGNYKGAHACKGSGDGEFHTPHSLCVDDRFGDSLMLVVDRENRRLVHLDFDGKFVRTYSRGLRRPCQVSFIGDHAVVSELEGRATILDKEGIPVAFLGDNPDTAQWAKYDLPVDHISPGCFSAAHGCYADPKGDIYISDWNKRGRVTKLTRTR